MRSYGTVRTTFVNVNEGAYSWTLNAGATYADKAFNGYVNTGWIPGVGNNPVQEAQWSKYAYHKLIGLKWRFYNFRIVIADTVTMPAITGPPAIPATQSVNIKTYDKYKFMIWFAQVQQLVNDAPSVSDEEQYKPVWVGKGKYEMKGYVPVSSTIWSDKTYSQTTAYNFLYDFLAYIRPKTGYGATTNVGTPTPSFWWFPVSPYPGTNFAALNLSSRFSVVFDYSVTTVWEHMYQVNS